MNREHDSQYMIRPAMGITQHSAVRAHDSARVLTIEACGPLTLCLDDTPFVFQRRKAAALLLYLAVTRRTHARDALADLLWGEMPQERAMANLRKSLSELRERVSGAVLITYHTVAINPDFPIILDVTTFEATIRRGMAASDPHILAQAVQVHADDFLSGFNVPQAETFAEWASLYREHLREQLIAALEALAMIHMERGAYRAALGPARRVVALDPWREAGQRQLMQVLAAVGDRAAAVALYERCRQTLAEELGVAPAAETVALYEQLRAGTDSPGENGARQLQVRTPRWVPEWGYDVTHARPPARRRGRSLLLACSLPGMLARTARPGDYMHTAQRHGRITVGQPGRDDLRHRSVTDYGIDAVAAGD